MSADQTKTPFIDKAGKIAAVGAAFVGAAAVIAAAVPQDEVAKKGLPALWESLKGVAHLTWLRLEEAYKTFRPVAFAWGAKLWSLIKWWTVLSIALIFAGIEVKTRFGSNFGHVLVAAGTISFTGLGILLFVLSDAIATILVFKIRLAGGLIGKAASIVGVDLSGMSGVSHEEIGNRIQKFHEKVKLVLAGTVVLSFSLLFTMFFPAWSTLGWTMVFWAMVAVALCAAIYLNMQMGMAVRVVFYATVGLLAATFVVFALDRLTGGALGFGGFQKWLLAINGSEILAAALILIPVTMLLMGVFSKDKDRKASFVSAAKYVGIGSAILGAFLLYKGTISWKQLSGKEPPEVVTKTADKVEGAYLKALEGGSKSDTTVAPIRAASGGGTYLPPPSGHIQPSDPPTTRAPAASTSKPRAKKQQLPPLKAKKYDDAASAVDDLESLL